jgi:hypothetical protein
MIDDSDETVNVQIVTEGLSRVAKQVSGDVHMSGTVDGNTVVKWAVALNVAQERVRKTRTRIWHYGDVGDDDQDAI